MVRSDDIDASRSEGARFNVYVSLIHNNKVSGQAWGSKDFSNLYD